MGVFGRTLPIKQSVAVVRPPFAHPFCSPFGSFWLLLFWLSFWPFVPFCPYPFVPFRLKIRRNGPTCNIISQRIMGIQVNLIDYWVALHHSAFSDIYFRLH